MFFLLHRFFLFFCISLFGFGFFYTPNVEAASLTIAPVSVSVEEGQNVTLTVSVSSPTEAMNALSGTITFSRNILEVISLSKTNSIVSLWVAEPSFSNSAGTVSFEGVVLNPGYQGSSGKVFSISFKAKTAGTATVSFSSGSVLANDGAGTNISQSLGSATISVTKKATGNEAPVASTLDGSATPLAPEIDSLTHPDPDGWYSISDATLSWERPRGITGVNILADQKPTTNPGTTSDGLISNYTYKGVKDGIWYAHLRFRNSAGWGAISHRRFQIDTKKPEDLVIATTTPARETDPFITLDLSARDLLSGIGTFHISIDGGEEVVLSPTEKEDTLFKAQFRSGVIPPGKHTIVIVAKDLAGNSLTESIDVATIPLLPPKITQYEAEISSRKSFTARGETYPLGEIDVFFKKEGGDDIEKKVRADGKGAFTVSATLPTGVYSVSFKVRLENGAESDLSLPISVKIAPSTLVLFGQNSLLVLSLIIPLIALIFLLSFLLWYSFQKLRNVRGGARRAERATHHAFNLLRKDIVRQIERLHGVSRMRDLTKEEQDVLTELSQNLASAEDFIEKEIIKLEEK